MSQRVGQVRTPPKRHASKSSTLGWSLGEYVGICWDMLGRDAAMSMRIHNNIYIYRWLYTHNLYTLDDIRIISAYIHAPWIHGINRIHIHTHTYIYMYIYNIYLIHIYIYILYTISIYTNAIICREPDGDTRRDASDSEAHVGRMCPTATTLGPGLAGWVKMVRAHFLETTSKLG